MSERSDCKTETTTAVARRRKTTMSRDRHPDFATVRQYLFWHASCCNQRVPPNRNPNDQPPGRSLRQPHVDEGNGLIHVCLFVCLWTGWLKKYGFVRSFVLCGQGSSLLWTPALRRYSGPVRLPRERKKIGRRVRCVLATCGEGGLSRSEQLVGYFYSAPLLDVAYCLA